MAESAVTTENGWALYAHPFFIARLSELIRRVQALIKKDPENFHRHPDYDLYESVSVYVRHHVPSNPNHKDFRQGSTLGKSYRHWFRVKKGLPSRYRLFFQFRSEAPKTILYAWFNDERTIRKDGDKNDVYAVFAALLKSKKMPNSYEELHAACKGLADAGDLTEAKED